MSPNPRDNDPQDDDPPDLVPPNPFHPDPDQPGNPHGAVASGHPDAPATAAALAALTARVYRLEQELAQQLSRQSATPASQPHLPGTHPPPSTDPSTAPPPVTAFNPPAPESPLAFSKAEYSKAEPLAAPVSLENRLGSQVFNRVGIVAVLIGATWFLKWAMDNHWIGPLGRVVIGLLTGAALVVWSERFRNKGFAAFSWSLKAVGSGILYLSLWAAFQVYHLVPGGVAFAAMVAVTCWNAYMAWSQDAELLAAYAALGGFITPILLSTGQDHAIFLFSYLLTLVLATVFLVRSRGWSRLLLGVFPGTALYYAGWYALGHSHAQPGVATTFVLLFFVAFATPSFSSATLGAADRGAGLIVDVLLPIANAVFTGAAIYVLLDDHAMHAWSPWVAVAFGAVYLLAVRIQHTRLAAAIHLSLGIVFLTLAIPLKASGRWIAIGWLAEAVALLWISWRLEAPSSDTPDDTPVSVHRTLRLLACAALVLGFCSLEFAPFEFAYIPRQPFLNARFASALAGLAALALAAWVSHLAHTARVSRGEAQDDSPPWLFIAAATIVGFNILALTAGIQEIDLFWFTGLHASDKLLGNALSVSAFLMAYGAVLLAAGFWKRNALLRWQALILLMFAICKVFLYDMSTLSQGYRVASFLALGVLLMAISFAYQKDLLGLREVAGLPGSHPEEKTT